MISVTGANLIGGRELLSREGAVSSREAATGRARSEVRFAEATDAEIAEAAEQSRAASGAAAGIDPGQRVALLDAIADALQDDPELLTAASEETGLPPGRISGELDRTTGQLRSFSRLVAEGSFVDAVIDTPPPGSGEGPDLRKVLVPVGPVAVFGASNFPLAFSVPGGDTAAALAAGCPVIAKAHPAHPETSARAGRAIVEAVASVGLHPGTFALVHGESHEVGRALVTAPEIRAVAFTGSEQGGRALLELATGRPDPIPVYAELGSVNPVVVTAQAIEERGPEIAEQLAGSITLGCGQFCTKPGLIFLPDDQRETFLGELSAHLAAAAPAPMLTAAIRESLVDQLSRSMQLAGVEVVAAGRAGDGGVTPTLLSSSLSTWTEHEALRREHFGPAAVAVTYPSLAALVQGLELLDGSLTATIHAGRDEDPGPAMDVLVRSAGRVVFDGVPTGVAVTPAMHHGGPYPATTHPGFTSVGTDSIRRFLRPVAYQNAPERLLPPELVGANPRSILRRVNGEVTRAPLSELGLGGGEPTGPR